MSDYFCTNGNRQELSPCAGQGTCQSCCPNGTVAGAALSSSCVCRDSFVQALQMLLRGGLSAYIDFTGFGFIADSVLVGANLTQPDTDAAAYDNLNDVLSATFSGFTPGACNYVDVSGDVYRPDVSPSVAGCLNGLLNAVIQNADTAGSTDLATLVAALNTLVGQTTTGSGTENTALITALNTALACNAVTGLQVSRLSLCNLRAIAFEPAGDTENAVNANYAAARQLMMNIIQPPCQNACPPYPDPCSSPEFFVAGRTVSVSAGPLEVSGAVVLGRIGNVLVLANDTDQRFYFICTDGADIIR